MNLVNRLPPLNHECSDGQTRVLADPLQHKFTLLVNIDRCWSGNILSYENPHFHVIIFMAHLHIILLGQTKDKSINYSILTILHKEKPWEQYG